jgi:glycosyltransferase involved in cell wall biosynthesis
MLLHGYFPDEPRVAAEARAATAAGFEVDVVGLRRPGEAAQDVIDDVRLRRLPVEHRRGAGFASIILEYLAFTLFATIDAARWSRRRRYDVVQVHNPPDFLVLAAIVPRLFGAKVVLDVHDIASYMFGMRFEGRLGASAADRALRLVELCAARASSAVLTVHEPYLQELTKHGVPKEKITIVMNSLDETLLPLPRLDAEAVDGFTIVYHGTVTPHYGVGLIVEAAGQLRDKVPGLCVEIYGDGDAISDLESRARTLGIESALHITGYLPQSDVLRAIQGASVGVVPNLPTPHNRFALSTKLLEYVALGVPVVSADLPTIKEYFSDEELLFFRAGDASSLAQALAEVAADPESAASRAAAARRRYESYRWEHSAAAYVDVLRRVASIDP